MVYLHSAPLPQEIKVRRYVLKILFSVDVVVDVEQVGPPVRRTVV